MSKILIKAATLLASFVLSLIYAVMKCLPTNSGKVVFLSRHYNAPGVDMCKLRSELESRRSDICCVILCKRLENTIGSAISFIPITLRSMFHLATAEVCILDSHWPVVSLLHHKKTLMVVQIWHAVGKVKKSGYQTIGRKYGHSEIIADSLKMHRGYDFIIAGGEKMNDFYCESFGVEKNRLLNYGLPRLDDLLEQHNHLRQSFEETYPLFAGKKLILYSPTFRREEFVGFDSVIQAFEKSGYALIIKPHPEQKIDRPELLEPYLLREASLNQLLSVCEYVITDYSAIIFEAAALRKKIFLYLPDYDQYLQFNGLNIDPKVVLKDISFDTIKDIKRKIEEEEYSFDTIDAFAKDYLPEDLGSATNKIGTLILDCLEKGKQFTIQKYRR